MALLSNIITPSNVLKDSDIGTSVQAYDADTTKNDVANTFTASQKIYGNGRGLLTLQTNDNTLSRGLAFQNSASAYIGFIGMEDAGSNLGNLSFASTSSTGATTPADITEIRMTITPTGNVGIGTASPSYKLDVSGVTRSTSFLETVYAVTGTTPAIAATNGNVQTWTLSGNSTPTDGLNAGESITLMIDDGSAYTITWTSLVDQWIGGSAPTLATTGYSVVELWKVGSTVYGAYVGDLS